MQWLLTGLPEDFIYDSGIYMKILPECMFFHFTADIYQNFMSQHITNL